MNDELKAPGAAEDAGLDFLAGPSGSVPIEKHAALIIKFVELQDKLDALPREIDPETCPPGCAELAELNREIREKLVAGDPAPADGTGDLLVAQVHLLDRLFQRMLQASYLDTQTLMNTERLRVALVAQRQCAHTNRTLHWAEWKKMLNFRERNEGCEK